VGAVEEEAIALGSGAGAAGVGRGDGTRDFHKRPMYAHTTGASSGCKKSSAAGRPLAYCIQRKQETNH
jgi:hypothetical protein